MTFNDKITIFCAICSFNFFLYRFFYWRGYHNGLVEAKRILLDVMHKKDES